MPDTMKVTYEVTAYDQDGAVVQQYTIEETANITIEDIKINTLFNDVYSITVGVLEVKIEKENGSIMEWNVDTTYCYCYYLF